MGFTYKVELKDDAGEWISAYRAWSGGSPEMAEGMLLTEADALRARLDKIGFDARVVLEQP